MIVGVFGLPGAGKSTFLAKCAYLWTHGKKFMNIEPHKVVFTNFECLGCYKLDFDKLGLYNFSDCNIIIDEIMLYADTRNFKTFPEHLKAFFALHRKSNIGGILWCSQYWDDCDKKIRVLTDRFYLLERGKLLKQFSFVKPIYRAMGVDNKHMTDKYILGAPLEWFWVYRPRYYSMFDSFESKLHALPPVDLIPWDSPPDPAPDPSPALPVSFDASDFGSPSRVQLAKEILFNDLHKKSPH